MTADRTLILAGVAAGGTAGTALAYFAPLGTTAPTNASTALAVGYLDAGWISEEGLSRGVDESINDIRAFGSGTPVRRLVTESTLTFKVTFLESNKTSLAVYHRLGLTGITVTAGAFVITEGTARTQTYAACFEMADGANKLRVFCPQVEVTDRDEFSIQAGEAVSYGVTMTAYPGSDGVAASYFYLIPTLT